MEELLDHILSGSALIISRSANLKIALARNLIIAASRRSMRVHVIDPGGVLAKYVEDLLASGLFDTEIKCEGELDYVILYEPRGAVRPLPCLTTAFITPGAKVRVARGFRKIYARPISGGVYELRDLINNIRWRIKQEGFALKPAELDPFHKRALDVLIESMSLYGEMTVKDAVRALVAELGVTKEEARRILIRLARSKYIAVRKGKLNIT